jgi:anti-sigma factor RsiW
MISEPDQQLLDEYLDGQLASADAQRLSRRLAQETELAGELSALRVARAVRKNVFESLAPQPASAEAFARRVVSATRRQSLRTRFGGLIRIGGGIAACIAIGFAAGWIGRGHGGASSPMAQVGSGGDGRTVVVSNSNTDRAPVQNAQLSGPFQVSLTDPDGKVLDVQRFDRIEDANAFADSMAREARRLQSNTDAQPVVYAGQF